MRYRMRRRDTERAEKPAQPLSVFDPAWDILDGVRHSTPSLPSPSNDAATLGRDEQP